MDTLNLSSKKRETYQVRLKYSPLWESALGIAAITNTPLLNTLEKPMSYWSSIKESISMNLLEHLEYVEKNNTWKALLQILHTKDFTDIEDLTNYIEQANSEDLRFICLPFVGRKFEDIRRQAIQENKTAIKELKKITSDNPFFPDYIQFICSVEINELKNHLIFVMQSWFEEVVKPNAKELTQILHNDYQAKKKMLTKMTAEEFVAWATGGVSYVPEPSVHYVLLIPQYIYRPWNIEADLDGTKVFYYPVSNESIYPNDKYMPDNFLVAKVKALGDEVRLKIVKLLFEQDRSLHDITDQLELGKSTVHHHLKQLRAAKIVEIKNSKYSLKLNSIDSLSKEIDSYLNK
ncbi:MULTISPECIES: ArsR/SmtB family transcription factor [Bacillaceae]|uniref:Winged helix-turn-helix domain-containing protein n=1 Tax=Evansella alkalicola TaxID=745819 RepID=A0ABS6JX40_9BACI|nr:MULTISPECIES: winged helix-turn-helix domain-containing protein [Bacillaceae]MBU9722797.1 winged helix-turn-helix domain-containing protein [Bacillus alkalicola]